MQSTMTSQTPEDYLASLPDGRRQEIETLHHLILDTLPDLDAHMWGSVIGPKESLWSASGSSIPNAPPITKHTSRAPCRRSSTQSLNASDVNVRPRLSSRHT